MAGQATATVEANDVARKKMPKTTPVRLTDDAIRWGRIASGYTGESMAEYVSRIVCERGKEDTDRLHAETTRPPKGKAPKGGEG